MKTTLRTQVKGPIKLIFLEDQTEVVSIYEHYLYCGFQAVISFGPLRIQISKVLKDWNDTWEGWLSKDSHSSVDKENEITASHPSFAVMANIFNSFCKAHNVQGWFTLHTQERCDTMISYVVNVYAKDFA